MKHLIIIGKGITSLVCAYKVLKTHPNIKITIISKDSFDKTCTFNSTSIVANRGVKRNISPLGDLICDAHDKFLDFYLNENPNGIEKGSEYVLAEKTNPEQFKKVQQRYGSKIYDCHNNDFLKYIINDFNNYLFFKEDAYFFSPLKFYQWLIEKLSPNFEFIQDEIIQVDEKNNQYILISKNNMFSCDILINATNTIPDYMNKFFKELIVSKPVSGTFAKFIPIKNKVYFQNSFSINLKGNHLIYRSNENRFIIGQTSNALITKPDLIGIDSIIKEFKRIFNLESLIDFNTQINLTGVRYKGKKRLPLMDKIKPNLYLFSNFYKNGYSFPFLATTKLEL